MLQRATRDVQDPTEISRHLAIVTYDAAVEAAMRLAAHHRGIGVRPEASFHDTLNKVRSAGLDWQPTGVRGVLELHASRNLAQHVGILPDAERVVGWGIAATTFVGSLIRAAFHVALDEILLSEAIRDAELRELMNRAERALISGDAIEAFIRADSAFNGARLRWRQRRLELRPGVHRIQPMILADPEPHTLDGAIDHQEVQVFATDMAQYTQFLATRRHVSTGGPVPDTGEARRALAFVLDWILHWEYFEAGYPADRYAEYWAELGPPDDGGPPAIAWTLPPQRTDRRGDRPDEYSVLVQFKNLPDRGKGDWGVDFRVALDQAKSELGLGSQQVVQQSSLTYGAMWFLFEEQLPPDSLATVLERATEIATALFTERQGTQDRERSRAAQLERELQSEIAAVCTPGAVYGVARVEPELTSDGPAYRAYIPLVNPMPREFNLAWNGFSGTGGQLASLRIDGVDITFLFRDLTETVREGIRAAVGATDETIRRYRQVESEAEQRLRAYARELSSRLGEPPAEHT